ncbi:MAG: PQQ-dependent sugar dehydrogenase [Proteobacteria bacterium]|nr:PQQ-dependent sugar dehydrogenase [Pseudomonadota bacterium]
MRRALWILALLAAAVTACRLLLPDRYVVNAPVLNTLLGGHEPPSEAERQRLRAPEGFSIQFFAEDLPNARFLRLTPAGDLLVSRPRAGEVTLLRPDADGDGRSDGRELLLAGLNRPHGLELHEGWLYVAETDAVGRIRFDPRTRRTRGEFERVLTGLPGGGNHWSRTVRFGPDGWLYLSVGSSCNVCEEADARRASLLRLRPDGSDVQIYATGLRNAVGFDWRPGTSELYATDNGRDLLGDDFPPCELNRVVEGGFYGWPYANGDRVPDPDLGDGRADLIRRSLPPVHDFRAHTAPLGIVFLRHAPEPEYRGAALVALHGSWNRTRKDGYEVVSLHWRDDGSIEEREFLSGFELDEDVIGRPVDVVEDERGRIYVSDDYAGAIYRIVRSDAAGMPARPAPRAAAAPGPPPDPRAVARGLELYQAHACATCHDPLRAAPGVVASPLTDLARRYDRAGLAALLRTPPSPMPVAALDDAQRDDLARYLLQAF